MSIINKKKKQEEQTTEAKTIELNGMTYTQFASQELNNKMNEVREKKSSLENIRDDLIKDIPKGDPGGQLANLFHETLQKIKDAETELLKTSRKYQVDSELLGLAGKIDSADSENRVIDLINSIVPLVNEIMPKIIEIEKIYGIEYYFPDFFVQIRKSMHNIVNAMNYELPKIKRPDKEEMIKRFNKKVSKVMEDKKEAQSITDKQNRYKDILK